MRDQEMPISIEALTSSAKDRRRFVQLQFSLYQDAPLWVPPLIRDELHALNPATNPGLEDCELLLWLAMRDGKCVGRIAGVINQRDNKLRDLKAARFCLLDFIDDDQVAQALLNAVENEHVGRGELDPSRVALLKVHPDKAIAIIRICGARV